jgi:hypothetical protein
VVARCPETPEVQTATACGRISYLLPSNELQDLCAGQMPFPPLPFRDARWGGPPHQPAGLPAPPIRVSPQSSPLRLSGLKWAAHISQRQPTTRVTSARCLVSEMLCSDSCQCRPLPSPPPPLQCCRSDFSGCFRSRSVECPLPLAARRGGVSSRHPPAVNHHLAAASPQLVLSPRLYRLRHLCMRTASGERISISIFSMTMQVGRRRCTGTTVGLSLHRSVLHPSELAMSCIGSIHVVIRPCHAHA